MRNSPTMLSGYLGAVVCCLLLIDSALAGPPFHTDDPVPIDFRHAEVYLFSAGVRDDGGTYGIGPAVELNYGVLPQTHLHIVLPLAFSVPNADASHVGYGDTEIGVKYRFVEQTANCPDIATFPIAEIPTGNAAENLGNGKAQLYLPLWVQKDFGPWTIYGGGGYWINPGTDNRDWEFYGVLAQYSFTEDFFLGIETFHETPSTVTSTENTGVHIGGGVPFILESQILFSMDAGNPITPYKHFGYYLGIYRKL